MGEWRSGGVDAGDLVRLEGEFESRLGNGWARGRLRHGDLVVAVQHAGDSFFTYMLLDVSRASVDGQPRLRIEPVPAPFGAYTMGRTVGRLTRAEMVEIQAGDGVTIEVPDEYEKPASADEERIDFATIGELKRALHRVPATMLGSRVDLLNDSGRPSGGGHVIIDHVRGRAHVMDND